MNKTLDMTKGNPIKLILVFMLPLFVGNLCQLLYNFFDSMISSHLISPDALAAIGATSAVNSLIVSMANGMGSGASIIISRAFGAKDPKRIRNSIFSILIINTVISLVVSFIVILLMDIIMHSLSVPADIYSLAKEYFVVIIAGLITTLMYNTLGGILRALGNSVVPLVVLMLSCAANIGGDFLFILVFKLGLAGSALSTVACQALSAIALWIYLVTKYPLYKIHKEDMYFEGNNIGDIVSTGLSMGMMNSIFAIGGILMTRSMNQLGSALINARTVSRRIIEICMLPESSLAAACSVFVSQNYGAKNIKRANQGVVISCMIVAVFSMVFLLILLVAKPLCVLIAATEEETVIQNALLSIRINMPFFFPLGVLLVIRNAFQSLNRKIIPLVSSSIELLLKVLSALVWIPKYGYIGEAVTEPMSWVICCIFVSIIYIYGYKTNMYEVEK